MIKIEYPPYQPKIKEADETTLIFDEFRKKWIVLTPEEWVRQNFLQYLTVVKKYPASCIAVEKEIKLGELTKRFDIVVYDKKMQPAIIVECKAMDVALSRLVLDQVLRYNQSLQVPCVVITNGSFCMAIHFDGNNMVELEKLPEL